MPQSARYFFYWEDILTRTKEFLVNFAVASFAVGAFSDNIKGIFVGIACLVCLLVLAINKKRG